MKIIFAVLLGLMFVACSTPETENLKKENLDLKAQLETVTKERDTLKTQLESIKAVLENAAGATSTTPNSSNTPLTPNAGSDMGTPDATATTPENSSSSASTPDNSTSSSAATTVTPPSTDGSSSSSTSPATTAPVSAVEAYAKSVLDTAQKYTTESGQTPPTDCSSGYTAGSHTIPSSDAIQACRVDRLEKGFSVTVKDSNGAVTTVSDSVAKP